jgi:hypothetical protein
MTDDYLRAGLRPLREGLVLALLAILFVSAWALPSACSKIR